MPDERTLSSATELAGETRRATGDARLPGFVPRPPHQVITAVTIENFKGFGRPVRIDLRPITLLFGRNSAGKSTILHALCYAHEILSHRAVDAHQLELGGGQIDLGGFRNFVHGHDLDRPVRLRFDLNLAGWSVPSLLLSEMKRLEYDETADADWSDAPWIATSDPPGFTGSGWVSLVVKWTSSWPSRVMVEGYEVGINDSIVGRICAGDNGEITLTINPAHPWFVDYLTAPPTPFVRHEAARDAFREPTVKEAELHDVAHGLTSPLPRWDQLIDIDCDDEQIPTGRADGKYLQLGGPGSNAFARLRGLVSAAFVGLGRTLRDELAQLRYIGPVRRLRPPDKIELGSSSPGSWSDGGAAWDLLAYQASDPAFRTPTLLDNVNDWMKRSDRLDAGYVLQRQTTVQLPADTPPVELILFREQLPDMFRNEAGDLDPEGWLRKQAVELADITGDEPEAIEARVKAPRDEGVATALEVTSGATAGDSAKAEWISATRQTYRLLADVVNRIDALERGRSPSDVQALVRAIAGARPQPSLQLLTAGENLPVRTSDVGVGISQLLPVVVAALDTNRPGITAIEQPELHAHPKLQVELGDLFAHAASDSRVFLLENHSEHLMLRLLRRIEETHNGELPAGKPALTPDQVSVVFMEQVDGEVKATRLRIDETGEFIDRWPHGFFEERSDELF